MWVLRHARTVKRAQARAGLPLDEEPSEDSKVLQSRRSEQLRQILADNPQDYLSKVLDTNGLTTEVSKDVINIQTFKHVGQPAGTFSMLMVPRQENYLHTLEANDVLIVELDNGLGESDVISIFLIDAVRRRKRAESNFSTTKKIVVTGRDLGKVLVETSVFVDSAPGFFATDLLKLIREFNLAVPGGKLGFTALPHQVVPSLIKAFASMQLHGELPPSELRKNPALQNVLGGNKPLQQFVFPGDVGTNMIDTFDLTDTSHGGYVEQTMGALANFTPPKDGSVTLWGMIDQFANRLVNEMFFDLRPVKADERPTDTAKKKTGELGSQRRKYRFSLVMRQQPFDLDAWNKLKTHVVQDHEVLEDDTGKSSHNIVNAFRVWLFNHGIPSLADQGWPSIYNLESIARHGLKRYEPQSVYPWPDHSSAQNQNNSKGEAARQSGFSTANQYLERIITWNAANEEYFEGTMTMRLRPGIRVGEKILFNSDDGDSIEFYIEAVSHNFNYPGTSTTTLTLTHGIPVMLDGHKIELAVQRLKLGDFKNIGPTFLGYTVFGDKKSFLLSSGIPQDTVPVTASSTQIAPADDTAAPPVGAKKDEQTKDQVKTLCEKYGEHGASPLPVISPALLYGVCGVESSFGRNLIARNWKGGPFYNPGVIDIALGLCQVKTATAQTSGGEPSATPEKLLSDNDFNMKCATTTLKSYRTSLNNALGTAPAPPNLLLAAYHNGIGFALRYVNLIIKALPPNSGPNTEPLSAAELANFNAILTASYATPALNYASRYRPPS